MIYKIVAIMVAVFGLFTIRNIESVSEGAIIYFISVELGALLVYGFGELVLVLLAIERNGRETTASISQFLTAIQER